MNARSTVKSVFRLGVLSLLLFAFGWGSYTMGRNAFLLYREKERRDREIAALEARNEALRRELAVLDEPNRIEREAKERYNLKAPGEDVVVVLPDEVVPDVSSGGRSFWERLTDFFHALFP